MRTYEERASYILKQRDVRLAKRHRIRSAITMSAVSVCSLALIVGACTSINNVIGKNSGVSISPDSANPSIGSGGGSGTADSQVAAPAAETIYNPGDIHSTYKFTMPEFPDVDFAIDNGIVTADGKKLFGGQMAPGICLADLNGDGYRELCTDWGVSAPTTPLDKGICALDFVKGEYYVLSDPTGNNEYHLSLEDGKLEYKYYIVLKDQSIERQGEFKLSDMKRVSDAYFVNKGEALPVEWVYNRGKCATASDFTMPEFPGVNFKVDGEAVSANGKNLYSGMPIFSVYLADLNGDGYRELCSETALGLGIANQQVWAYDYANSELYQLSGRGKYDTLALEDGLLKYKSYAYPPKSGDTPEEEGTLTLSVMKRIDENPEQTTAPKPEKVYDRNDHLNSSRLFEFTMPEFPDVNFKIENYTVYANGKPLYRGMLINTVYLADLNGDGYREICSDIDYGSGIIDKRILVYDYANSELCDLSRRMEYDYSLVLEDGVLKYQKRLSFYLNSNKEDDTIIETGVLTFSVMKGVAENDSKRFPPAEKLYPRDNSDIENILEINDNFEFTIPEVPESSFKLVRGVLSCDGEFLLQGYPIHSIYLGDLNGDGVREVVAEYSVGEGIVNMNIFAFDPVAKELYTLSDTGGKEYVLTFNIDVLGYKHCIYDESGITTDEQGVLTLSRMSKFSGLCGLPKADSNS